MKLFAALNIQCCTPFDIPMEPQFTGEDAQTPEDRRKVEAQSEAISIAVDLHNKFTLKFKASPLCQKNLT